MTRLFLSLYLFIALTLIILSTILNQLFFSDERLNSEIQQHALNSTISMLNQQQQLSLDKVKSLGLSAKQINQDALAWTANDLNLLASGKTVTLYDPNLGNQIYFKTDEENLIEVTLPFDSTKSYQNYLYSSAFFLLLAIGIALWVWPLWRDLQKLKEATKVIDLSGQYAPIEMEPHSVVYPVASAFNELGERVRQLLNTQLELTGAVAHEFRTPLARLKFALAAQPPEQIKHWQSINDDLDELDKLVQEMLHYTSLESQQNELNVSEIPLLSFCQQRMSLLTPNTIQDNSFIFLGDDITVLADEHFIARAVDNLLHNSCRYARSKIRIKVERQLNEVILSVEDDGAGLLEAHYTRIFEPFFRADDGRDRKQGGAGLGLAIVKRIMMWHQGRCWAESSDLGGAQICLAFKQSQQIELGN